MTLEIAAATDAGRVRPHNEDALRFDAARGYAVLADGLGGCNAGEVASQMAVEIVASALDTALTPGRLAIERARATIADAIARANAAIIEAANASAECFGMGTTLVIALWLENELVAAHVGDSRLYRRRATALVQLTRDHSLLQQNIDAGLVPASAARFAAGRAAVTRAIGADLRVRADVSNFAVEAEDLYLLCSDGLTDMLTDAQIERVLARCLDEALPAAGRARANVLTSATDALVQAANAAGGRDNISVIIARVGTAAT